MAIITVGTGTSVLRGWSQWPCPTTEIAAGRFLSRDEIRDAVERASLRLVRARSRLGQPPSEASTPEDPVEDESPAAGLVGWLAAPGPVGG